MTPEAQRIAIAQACGWKRAPKHDYLSADKKMVMWEKDGYLSEQDKLPDYLHDLNAMHEAEASLPTQERPTYQHWLDKVCATDKDPHCSCWDFIHATAAQRAEAFLRTIGKWQEDKP